MNLDELRSVQNRERATDSLQELRDSFYGDVAEYVEGLREERDRHAEAAEDPFGHPDVSRLTDEIEMAEQVAEAIYERRVGKIVKQASLAAAGMSGDTEGLTEEERDLYGDLVALIESNKEHVLDVLAGDADASINVSDASPADGPAASESPADRGGVDASAAMGGSDAEPSADAGGDEMPADETAMAEAVAGADGDDDDSDDARSSDEDDAPTVSRDTVRITRDVGEIFGVDEQVYELEAEDVVQLPAENAAPLVEREAAEKLE